MRCDPSRLKEAVARVEHGLRDAETALLKKDPQGLEEATRIHEEGLAEIKRLLALPGALESDRGEVQELLAALLSRVQAVSRKIADWQQELACGMTELRQERTRLKALAAAAGSGTVPPRPRP